jgi:hypothetical protein
MNRNSRQEAEHGSYLIVNEVRSSNLVLPTRLVSAFWLAIGFIDVGEHRFKVPVRPWTKDPHLKELERYYRIYWEEGIQRWTMMLLTKILNVRMPLFDDLYMKLAPVVETRRS